MQPSEPTSQAGPSRPKSTSTKVLSDTRAAIQSRQYQADLKTRDRPEAEVQRRQLGNLRRQQRYRDKHRAKAESDDTQPPPAKRSKRAHNPSVLPTAGPSSAHGSAAAASTSTVGLQSLYGSPNDPTPNAHTTPTRSSLSSAPLHPDDPSAAPTKDENIDPILRDLQEKDNLAVLSLRQPTEHTDNRQSRVDASVNTFATYAEVSVNTDLVKSRSPSPSFWRSPISPISGIGDLPTAEYSSRLDFVSGIRGVMLPHDSQSVTWAGGRQTLLPPVPTTFRDAKMTAAWAAFPEAVPGSEIFGFLSGTQNADVLSEARDILRQGNMVVVRNFRDVHGFEFTSAGLEKSFGITPMCPVTLHDIHKRSWASSKPHMHGTVGSLIEGINNPSHNIDDGLVLGWNQTTAYNDNVGAKVSPGNWMSTSWALAHHPGVLTYPHHDADGYNTFMVVMSGAKFWIVIRLNDPAAPFEDTRALIETICTHTTRPAMWADRATAEVVFLNPGDALLQPAGSLHAVYTPDASFCTGGFFSCLDTLHLMEHSHRVDATLAPLVTNQEHEHCLDTLYAQTLCREILEHLHSDIDCATQELHAVNTSYKDAGPLLDIHPFLDQLALSRMSQYTNRQRRS
ncbi:hypothetical protein BJ138DRAFT_1119778 [Hygrophoropsis aurantiaca]|uniref:Uncharacterized protein n=1 Tax=Hygrophoropsis aurantiaca TaxID=72124 RepID=A0ACB7ZTQ3_9AGAM|nr:hypothetical protein BJ138DRAFT_1119778 [Hygrophoropsis aurantiaca]